MTAYTDQGRIEHIDIEYGGLRVRRQAEEERRRDSTSSEAVRSHILTIRGSVQLYEDRIFTHHTIYVGGFLLTHIGESGFGARILQRDLTPVAPLVMF
jgi:hypothetical protein